MRLEAQSEVVREAFPAALTDIAILITELGSAEFAVVFLALLFWLTRRHDTALVVTYALAAGVFVLGVKTLLAMPRPPEEIALIAGSRDDPYGFPSGHSYFAVVLYGGLLVAFDRLDRPELVVGAAVLAFLIGLSRVVLGVHYLGDLLAGWALGLAVLAALHVLVAGDLRRGFGIATGLAAVTIALSTPDLPVQVLSDAIVEELWLLGGIAAGGLLAAYMVEIEDLPSLRSRREAIVVTVVGLAWIVLTMAAADLVTGPAVAVLGAAMIVGILLVPEAVGRLESPALEATPPKTA